MPDYVVEFGHVGAPPQPDGRLDAPAYHRNHQAIWSVLSGYLTDKSGDVLEIGSGTGQHAVTFAKLAPRLTWWPSDVNDKHLQSIAAWRDFAALPNVKPPLRLDLMQETVDPESLGLPRDCIAVFCANVIHIAPWRVAENLFALAGKVLGADGRLFLYGPFRHDGQFTAPSNAAFDRKLRGDNPDWGVRDIADLRRLAEAAGLRLADIVDMPANNNILVFVR